MGIAGLERQLLGGSDGKIGFDFPPRPVKLVAAKKTAKAKEA